MYYQKVNHCLDRMSYSVIFLLLIQLLKKNKLHVVRHDGGKKRHVTEFSEIRLSGTSFWLRHYKHVSKM